MGQTPDRTPGPSVEEETIYEDNGGTTSGPGAVRYTGGSFEMEDSVGKFDPRTGGGGLTAATHRPLDQLVHEIAEDSYEEYEYTGNRVDAIRVYTDSGKATKIRETDFTYTGNKVTTIVTKQYDGAGVLITGETMTETLSYTGSQLDDIDRVMS